TTSSSISLPSATTAPSHFPHFFFIHAATTKIYTLSLTRRSSDLRWKATFMPDNPGPEADLSAAERFYTGLLVTFRLYSCASATRDRKSTRLNSSHRTISYAVFCLKKKKKKTNIIITNHMTQHSLI